MKACRSLSRRIIPSSSRRRAWLASLSLVQEVGPVEVHTNWPGQPSDRYRQGYSSEVSGT